jgi:5'-deoxynucleotidase YfbR-like HD superfamily hydrolase
MTIDIEALLGGTVRRLSHVRRYAALNVARIENVAEHAYYVALIAMCIARDLRSRGHGIEFERVVAGALCHDLDESIAGDLPRPFIRSVTELRDRLDEVNLRFVRGIGREIGLDFSHDWCVQRGGELEGRIVSLADDLEIVAYVAEQVRSGNGYFYGVAREVSRSLGESESDYPPELREYVRAAQSWLETIETDEIPGDGERLSKLLEDDDE